MSAVTIPILPAIELKRILFTTDFTEASRMALPIASAVARRYGAKVFLAHVVTPSVYPMVAPEVVTVLNRKSEREAKSDLDKLQRLPILEGVNAETLLKQGTPVDEIARLVAQHDISLVVMGTHGMTGFRHRVLGSVAEEVVRTLRCPVLTVGPRLGERFAALNSIKKILFPTDLSPQSMCVFAYLTSLAREYQSELTILHVLAPNTLEAKSAAERARSQLKNALEKEISPRCRAEFVIESGDPAEAILAHAQRTDADLIGLGVRGWTDISKHFRETATYRVLAEAGCPVLTQQGNA